MFVVFPEICEQTAHRHTLNMITIPFPLRFVPKVMKTIFNNSAVCTYKCTSIHVHVLYSFSCILHPLIYTCSYQLFIFLALYTSHIHSYTCKYMYYENPADLPIWAPSAVITLIQFLPSVSSILTFDPWASSLNPWSCGTILIQGGHSLSGGGESGIPWRHLGGAISPSSGDSKKKTLHYRYMYLLVMCNKDQYIHVLGAGLEKRFKPSLVCCAFETKSLPLKLCNYAQFNVCTCTLVQSNVHVYC